MDRKKMIPLAMPAELVSEVDEWRYNLRPVPSRNEALRRLIEVGLAATKTRGPRRNSVASPEM